MDLKSYFDDLFLSDATYGLDPFDKTGSVDSYMDGDEYVLVFRDENSYDDQSYELRVRPL